MRSEDPHEGQGVAGDLEEVLPGEGLEDEEVEAHGRGDLGQLHHEHQVDAKPQGIHPDGLHHGEVQTVEQ
jgi:hypothetical protein